MVDSVCFSLNQRSMKVSRSGTVSYAYNKPFWSLRRLGSLGSSRIRWVLASHRAWRTRSGTIGYSRGCRSLSSLLFLSLCHGNTTYHNHCRRNHLLHRCCSNHLRQLCTSSWSSLLGGAAVRISPALDGTIVCLLSSLFLLGLIPVLQRDLQKSDVF